jgi:hypothetical protein
MPKNSSIFSSEQIRSARRLPRSEGRRLLGTLAIVIAVALLAVVVKLNARSVLLNEQLYPTPEIDSLSDATRILTFGSSHVAFGVNPMLFSQPAMNLGVDGQDYIIEDRLVEKALDLVPRLDVAIVEFDVVLLARTVERGNDRRRFYRMGLAIWDLDQPDTLWERIRRNWIWFMGPDLIYERLTPRDLWDHRKPETSTLAPGHRPKYGRIPANYDGLPRVRAHLKQHRDSKADYRVNLRALHTTIERIRARNIAVVLVHWPHHRSYWEHWPPEFERILQPSLVEVEERWLKDAGSGVQYWDYGRSWRFRDENFIDSNHLNHVGAGRFTRLLDRRLLESGLIEGPGQRTR